MSLEQRVREGSRKEDMIEHAPERYCEEQALFSKRAELPNTRASDVSIPSVTWCELDVGKKTASVQARLERFERGDPEKWCRSNQNAANVQGWCFRPPDPLCTSRAAVR